ncbi:uncharacterized protein LOC120216603 isoform X2 [Hibiscus syriacus]|uniref:uncharacterized protein LOC120216603 isoform X2 n=1 Tax=Hibiscus syriacus TaxID=106335 RepID=UPI0019226E30|nr:uncharacterized protein LOC120216603 isoform X2 [Hibiscus syriacus]
MGKSKTQRKNAAMLDSDDDTCSVSSSSAMRSDRMSLAGIEEVEFNKDSLLDEAVDALYEKRGSTREKALSVIIEAFNSNLQHQFVEKKFATLLHQCLNSIKKGSSKEISLASHSIGCFCEAFCSCNNSSCVCLVISFDNISNVEKRMYKSPNSALNKARTQLLNKQRMLSAGRNIGHYSVNGGDEDS